MAQYLDVHVSPMRDKGDETRDLSALDMAVQSIVQLP
jgi:hypothetical protein